MSTCQFSALMKKNLFHFLSIIACAMGMKRYVEANISLKSHTTVKYFMKMWSSVSDTLIFIFLGVSTIGENHEWNWPYICFTVIFCLIWRALGMVKSCFFWWLFEWNIQFCEMGECFCSQHHPLLFPCVCGYYRCESKDWKGLPQLMFLLLQNCCLAQNQAMPLTAISYPVQPPQTALVLNRNSHI